MPLFVVKFIVGQIKVRFREITIVHTGLDLKGKIALPWLFLVRKEPTSLSLLTAGINFVFLSMGNV